MASVNMFNFTEMCRVAEYCSGIATRQALDDLTRPRGILDHIINFFTFGCMRRELSSPYEAFAQAMTEALVQQSNSGFSPCSIPERLRYEPPRFSWRVFELCSRCQIFARV